MKKQRQFRPERGGLGSRPAFDGHADRKALYDTTWEKYRLQFLNINPQCYACGAKANEVDHLVAHQGDKRLFEKLDNHLPMCKSCHSYVTAKFDRNYKRGNHINPKLNWLARSRGTKNLTFRVKVLPKYG